jgi:tetratricopeptide (TPR) repeat protein
MTDLRDRYCTLIDDLVQRALQGPIVADEWANEWVYTALVEELEPDTLDLFEHCLDDQFLIVEQRTVASQLSVRTQAASVLAALTLIQTAWQRYQQALRSKATIAQAMHRITSAEPSERLTAFVSTIDPNQAQALDPDQLQQLAIALRLAMGDSDSREALQQFATGILQGLRSWQAIVPHLVTWLESPVPTTARADPMAALPRSPWRLWAAQAIGPLPQAVFTVLDHQQSLADWAADCQAMDLPNWVELVVVFQRVQQGLLTWANQQPYADQPASRLMTSLYLGFAGTWTQFSSGLARSTYLNTYHREQFSQSAMQVGWQFLHQFAQSQHFPLYGNPIVLLGEQNFRNAMQYLNQPLDATDAPADKARILALVGASLRVAGQLQQALAVHHSALDMAQQSGDQRCVIAHLNYLSRLALRQQERDRAIAQSQRALILARQIGDVMGEANALANLGAAEASQQAQCLAPHPAYATALSYLMQAAEKAKTLEDHPSEALCATSLAQVCLMLGHPGEALNWIQTGLQRSAVCGDVYLQALNFATMAQACYDLQHPADAIYAACLALYHFDQLHCPEWRQPAALLTQMQGRLGNRFEELLQNELGEIIHQIGVDGFAQIPELLERYRVGEL